MGQSTLSQLSPHRGASICGQARKPKPNKIETMDTASSAFIIKRQGKLGYALSTGEREGRGIYDTISLVVEWQALGVWRGGSNLALVLPCIYVWTYKGTMYVQIPKAPGLWYLELESSTTAINYGADT